MNANAVKATLPALIDSLRNAQKWPEKMTVLDFIDTLIRTAPTQTSLRVPELIPVVSEAMWDTKKEVKDRAYKTMEKVCQLIVNRDIERFIPELIKCIAKPENVPETVPCSVPPLSSPRSRSPLLPSWFPCSTVVLVSATLPSSVRPLSSSTTCASSSTTRTSLLLSCPR